MVERDGFDFVCYFWFGGWGYGGGLLGLCVGGGFVMFFCLKVCFWKFFSVVDIFVMVLWILEY